MTFDAAAAHRVIQFERLAELRIRREWRNKNNAQIALLESLLDLNHDEVPDAERLRTMGGMG